MDKRLSVLAMSNSLVPRRSNLQLYGSEIQNEGELNWEAFDEEWPPRNKHRLLGKIHD